MQGRVGRREELNVLVGIDEGAIVEGRLGALVDDEDRVVDAIKDRLKGFLRAD